MSSSVEDWLRSLGFIHYTQAFLDNGYDELDICKEIGKEDLDAIGVRNFKDRTDILNAVERLKQSGTAVYFVLEGNADSESLAAQPERESYPPIQLKMMLRDKLEEDKIDLTALPYTLPVSTCWFILLFIFSINIDRPDIYSINVQGQTVSRAGIENVQSNGCFASTRNVRG